MQNLESLIDAPFDFNLREDITSGTPVLGMSAMYYSRAVACFRVLLTMIMRFHSFS